MFTQVRALAKHHAVVIVAFSVALISAAFVPPDKEYRQYFETRTLMCLFATMAVIAALDNVHFFSALGEKVIRLFRSRRTIIIGLIYLTFIGAMLISNDMALLTFLPLTYIALKETGNLRYLAFVFVMEAAAANLGGMITPFGSPQNLFLYTKFEIPANEFFTLMAIPFIISIVTITLICLAIRNEPNAEIEMDTYFKAWPTAIYLILFAVAVLMVFRVLPISAGFAVAGIILILDPKAFLKLDWGLLLTFVFFFVFTGNMARIDTVDSALSGVLQGNVLIWSALGSQVISNVPAAILFAQFTDEYRELLVGVNIGGVGTIIASLASLIALSKFRTYQPDQTNKFMQIFSIVNFGLLISLLIVMELLFTLGWV